MFVKTGVVFMQLLTVHVFIFKWYHPQVCMNGLCSDYMANKCIQCQLEGSCIIRTYMHM